MSHVRLLSHACAGGRRQSKPGGSWHAVQVDLADLRSVERVGVGHEIRVSNVSNEDGEYVDPGGPAIPAQKA
jgi:hypothetical protein